MDTQLKREGKTKSALTIRIATINLNNCGEWSHANKFTHFAHALLHDLKLPHIVALQEVGGIAKDKTTPVQAKAGEMLVEAIFKLSGARYQYLDIPPLPDTTGGAEDANIRSAFLMLNAHSNSDANPMNTPVTSQIEASASLPPLPPLDIEVLKLETIGDDSPPFCGDLATGIKPSRKPLLLEIALHAQDQKTKNRPKILRLINCHLKSKNSHSRDEERLAKRQRNAQANIIVEHLNTLPQSVPSIILGDFNDTPNSDTLAILQSPGLTSLWKDYTGRIYTLKHRNQPIVLDYILYPPELRASHINIRHINTYLGNEKRFSDHDPIVADFSFLN